MDMITFGSKEEGREYIWRPAVYCLMFNNQKDKIAIIETSNGRYFLPGGGIENNETHEECLKREAIEEMGTDIDIGPFIGCARQYFSSTNEYKHYLNEGYFYLCGAGRQISDMDRSISSNNKFISRTSKLGS
ncbi:8-oxo-dGTP diphosphatase [Scopulibacillus daqui]|uniref:8-oxo-dGTP diphosphatase n=1 Tax=Scopulibacillus daqui TaxID=1469162 RepID=A0ABS2Q5G8_9BACL|nr:NUDIX domain-containing protein [Scopulibacillus daqui]MBM7647070.1 8-oxo-dGTP diphosphatase [Scopulibacillus daqui]